jgi:hypothetical protein
MTRRREGEVGGWDARPYRGPERTHAWQARLQRDRPAMTDGVLGQHILPKAAVRPYHADADMTGRACRAGLQRRWQRGSFGIDILVTAG